MIREELEMRECDILSPFAMRAKDTRGRLVPEEECDIRTAYMRDRDRIVHCKSFRRLKDKTQVFLAPQGDHYRTRLMHTLEVSQTARTAAKALRLNEDLVEAIALGHDLGHTPCGRAGERALRDIMGGAFHHYEQSLRVVDRVEKDGRGLNLCYETRMGILNHTYGAPDDTTEATIVRFSDRIAYLNHDLDDALRAGILTDGDVPEPIRRVFGTRNSQRINTILLDLIRNSAGGTVQMSEEVAEVFDIFHNFMFDAVYRNPTAKSEESKVKGILGGIFDHYVGHMDELPEEFQDIARTDGAERAVCDYVAGMTDGYAMEVYGRLFIPAAWSVK
jgi:dGTPase